MRVNGSCHCGAITVEAEVDETQVAVCHCLDCQILSGSPFRTVAITPWESLVVRGEPNTYVKVSESGRRRAQRFCANCGTPLYAENADASGGMVTLRTGFLAQRAQLTPRFQIWRCSAESWVDNLAAIAPHERQEPLESLQADIPISE